MASESRSLDLYNVDTYVTNYFNGAKADVVVGNVIRMYDFMVAAQLAALWWKHKHMYDDKHYIQDGGNNTSQSSDQTTEHQATFQDNLALFPDTVTDPILQWNWKQGGDRILASDMNIIRGMMEGIRTHTHDVTDHDNWQA